MIPMRISNEQRTIGLVAVFASLTLAITLGIIYPTVKYINHINDDALRLRQNLENRQARVKNLRHSLAEADNVKTQVEDYGQRLFHAGDELKLITFLESLAEDVGIEQKISNTNLDKNPDGQVIADIAATGSYTALLRYLAALENGQYFLNVVSLRFAPVGKDNLYSLHLKFSLYVSK